MVAVTKTLESTGNSEGAMISAVGGGLTVAGADGGHFDAEATLHSLATLSLDDDNAGDWIQLKADMDG